MTRNVLMATCAAIALSLTPAMAADAGRGVVEMAQATQPNAPTQSRPGATEQGGMRANDPGTKTPPTATMGQPDGSSGRVPMPSTTTGAVPPTPSQMNTPQQSRSGAAEQGGERTNDPGAGTPATGTRITPPGAAMQAQPPMPNSPPGSTTTGMPSQGNAPVQSRPGAAEQGGMRTNDPGTANPPTTRTN
ncbi:MAG: hypothetical protein AB7P02_21030 [Alphaproteobacteria bacterium]